jgi:hypothetical protein
MIDLHLLFTKVQMYFISGWGIIFSNLKRVKTKLINGVNDISPFLSFNSFFCLQESKKFIFTSELCSY